MKKILLLGGGTWHDFSGVGAVVREALAPVASVEYTEDVGRLSVKGLAGYDGLALYTCWFTGDDTLADKSKASLPGHAQRAVEDFVAGGKAFLPLHSIICSYGNWTRLGEMIGFTWDWGVAGHDPQETFTSRWHHAHPLWAGAEDITLFDEKYHALRQIRPVDIFMESEWQGRSQPLGWTTTFGKGRVMYSALGHTPEAMGHPVHTAMLRRGLRWALGGPPRVSVSEH
jgi:type 1 glutamine amidotransferase